MKLQYHDGGETITIKVRHSYYSHITSNIIVFLILFGLTLVFLISYSNLIPFILMIVIIIITNRKQVVTIDKGHRKLITKHSSFDVKNTDKVILSRKNKAYWGMNEDTGKNSNYLGNIVIHHLYFQSGESKPIPLLQHDPKGINIGNIETHEDVLFTFNRVGEFISKELKIILVDQTGEVETIIDPDKTDAFIASRFREKDLKYQSEFEQIDQGNLSSIDNIELSKNSSGNYEMSVITDPLNFWDIFRFILAIAIIFLMGSFISLIYNYIRGVDEEIKTIKIAIYITAGIFILLAFLLIWQAVLLISNSFDKYLLEISPLAISVRVNTLFFKRKQLQLPLESLERLIIFQTVSRLKLNHYFLELVTDETRIKSLYSRNKEQLLKIREILIELFVYLSKTNWIGIESF